MTKRPPAEDSTVVSDPEDGHHCWNPYRGADYAGAIYGSLLTASTIVGTSAVRTADTSSSRLLEELVVTSTVFWLIHVYVRAVGRELPAQVPWARATGRAARHEIPILLAVIPPAAVVLLGMVLKEPADQVGWAALGMALADEVFWTWFAVRQSNTHRGIAILSMAISFSLGLALVALKTSVSH
jgi:hypothetical protein